MSANSGLRSMVLDGLLRTPVQRGFEAVAWDVAIGKIQSPTTDDVRIYTAAKFFGTQLNGLRQALGEAPPPRGHVDIQLRRAIGFVNREYAVLEQKLSVKEAVKFEVFDDFVNQQIELRGGVNSATPEDIVESIVDGLRFELASLKAGLGGIRFATTGDAAMRVAKRGNLSVFYHAFEEQWLDCLHHGWGVLTRDRVAIIQPMVKQAALDMAVADYRQRSLDSELTARLGQAMNADRPRVRGVVRSRSGKDRVYDVEALDELQSFQLVLAQLNGLEPDLEPFLDVPLPELGGLCVRDLLAVWGALGPFARRTSKERDDLVETLGQLEQFSPVEDKQALLDALHQCTGIARSKCLIAIEQLTWRNVRDSLWLRPIVPLASGRIVFVRPALGVPNLRRSIEYWIEEGGIDLMERGEPWEQYVRTDIAAALRKSKILADSSGVLEHGASPSEVSVGDIDLIFWVGGAVVVGEIKCLVRPGTSHERFVFESRIQDAAEQAQRKAKFVESNVAWLDQMVGRRISEELTEILPCVVINSALGTLRTVRDVPIVDLYVLERYLLDGSATKYASIDEEGGGLKVVFYETAKQAEERLGGYLRAPSHLIDYRKSIALKPSRQFSFAGDVDEIIWIHLLVKPNVPREFRATTGTD